MATINAVNTTLSGQTGTGSFAGSTSPVFVTPALGTPASGTLTSCTGLPVAGIATGTFSAVHVTTSAGVSAFSSTMTNGQIIIGSTGATPTAGTITAGAGVSVTNGAGTITIASVGGGVTWTDVTGTSQAMAINNGYIADNGSLVTLTLPASAALGSVINVMGLGAGGWLIAQNSGQLIRLGSSVTTTGVGGSLASSNRYDSLVIVCVITDTTWSVLGGPQGNITVV